MHPQLAVLLHRPGADQLGAIYGAKAGLGSVAGDNLPELTDTSGQGFITGGRNQRIVQPVLSAAPIDRVPGQPTPSRPARGGITQPALHGGIRPWQTERLSGAHTIIVRRHHKGLRMQQPFGGTSDGLQRTPPADRSTGDGCGTYSPPPAAGSINSRGAW